MTPSVRFQPIRISASDGGEDGCLGLADEELVTILVGLPSANAEQSWYLETGFGRCDREGLIFASLGAAEAWIRDQYAAGALSGN